MAVGRLRATGQLEAGLACGRDLAGGRRAEDENAGLGQWPPECERFANGRDAERGGPASSAAAAQSAAPCP